MRKMDEDRLRKLGEGAMPNEIGRENLLFYIQKIFDIFEEDLKEMVAEQAPHVDRDKLNKSIEEVLSKEKEHIATEMNLALQLLLYLVLEGSPLAVSYRRSVLEVVKQVTNKFHPSNLTSVAFGATIQDAVERAEVEFGLKGSPGKTRVTVGPVFFMTGKEGSC